MARAIYIVLHSRNRWWVDFEGKPYGPFTSREIARGEAISMAKFMSHGGRPTEVRVPDDNGHWWMEWESAEDPRWSRWKPGARPLTDPGAGKGLSPSRLGADVPQVRIPGLTAA